MTCAVMIKMISNTSATSTNGVTLISAIAGKPRDRRSPLAVRLNAMSLLASLARRSLDHIDEFEQKVVKTVAHLFQPATENVVKNRRRNGRNQANPSRNQRIRHAWPHRGQAGCASRRAQSVEN